jgi:hypothetical protein
MYKGISKGEIVRGIFGFPYFRSLGTLSSDIDSLNKNQQIRFYTSNEKFDRIKFYLPKYSWDENAPHYYIYVKDNHNFNNTKRPVIEPLLENKYYAIYMAT